MKKLLLIILLVLLMAGGVVLLKKRKQTVVETPVATEMAHTVRTVRPADGTVTEFRRFLAQLESVNRADLASKLSGRISEIKVQESQQVAEGDLLVTIDDQEIRAGISGLQAQLDAARTSHESARAQYGRDLALFKAGGLAREKLDLSRVSSSSAKAAVLDLEQKIKGLESQLEYTRIRAPFSGVIGSILLRQGDLAVPGRSLLTLHSPDQKLLFSFMPEQDQIVIGQQVRFKDGTGTVTNLYNEAKNGLAVAEIRSDKPINQPSKSFVTVEVVLKSETGCTVPPNSLLHRPEQVSIMIYQNDQFREQVVTVAAMDREAAVITPCPTEPVAAASEAKLSLLPTYGRIRIIAGEDNE